MKNKKNAESDFGRDVVPFSSSVFSFFSCQRDDINMYCNRTAYTKTHYTFV